MAPIKKPISKAAPAPVAKVAPAPLAKVTPTPAPMATAPVVKAAPVSNVAAALAAPAPVSAPVPMAPAPTAIPMNVEAIRKTAEQTMAGAQEQFRKVVEQSVEQSRATYDKMKAAAEEATSSIESSYSVASNGVTTFNAKAIDAMKAQSEATLEHVKAVMAAKSVGEAIALQTSHARKQFETFSAQAKEMAELAQKIATEATAPLKSTFAKGFAA
jgi:phasin